MSNEAYKGTVRLTVAQAIIRFLSNQYTERDGVERRLIAGAFGIFGHGNVAGIGQALLQNEIAPSEGENPMPYIMPRNEQGAVHAAAAFAKTTNRLQTWMTTASIGPGSLNMVTGAATATTNRLPVLIFPSDQFATRIPDPVLQQLEDPMSLDVTVNDAFRPVSRFFDRINRPEQLIPSLLAGMRVLTDPAETGAVTIALPQDVQAEAYDWPVEFFAKRVWHVRRPPVERAALKRAVAKIRAAKRPLIIAGGGAIYSEASEELRAFAAVTGIPVADTQAGKGAINCDHPCSVGGVGSTGGDSGNHLADKADLIIGVGTRYSDFTTASKTQFKNPDVSFVNINITPFDAAKQSAEMVVADAREALAALTEELADYRVDESYTAEIAAEREAWAAKVEQCYHVGNAPLPAQTEVFGALNELMGDEDVVINAAGSMPGDLQALWQAKTPSSTTSSTPSPAWVTRCRPPWASSWRARSPRSSRSSATVAIRCSRWSWPRLPRKVSRSSTFCCRTTASLRSAPSPSRAAPSASARSTASAARARTLRTTSVSPASISLRMPVPGELM